MITLILATVWSMGGYAAVGDTYKLVTSTDELKDGDVIVLAESYNKAVMTDYNSSGYYNYIKFTNSIGDDGIFTSNSDKISELVLEEDNGKLYLKISSDYLYCGKSGKLYKSTSKQSKCSASIVFSDKNAKISFNGESWYICYNSGSPRFACYSGGATSQQRWVQIYKKASSKTLTSLAISGTPTKTTYNAGDEFDPTGLVVTGTYDDKSTETITDGITWTTTPAKLSAGITSCSVTATVGDVTSEPYEVNGLNVVYAISLSIDPATSTVVKAPVNVTLTATEGAAVYYTTDGSEPTTNSTKYNAPFEVTKSGTTVKAIAVAEGAENATAEATYTIKPDQPKFSDASKTFGEAFNVTLSLPETTDESSTIHYAIGKTATAESDKYTEPVNISAENDGDQVVLHAVVVDKYGNVGKEKYCTYTKSTNIVFDFTANPNVWKITPLAKNEKTGDNVIAGKELEVNNVVMTATNGDSFGTCLYLTASDNTVNLRVYSGGSITFTAPEGYNLSEISYDFVLDNSGTFTTTESNWKTPTWTGNAHTVTFNCSKSSRIYTAAIKLVAVEPTSGTLTFKAQNSDGYYATFSSDKDVVFTKDVVVYGVNVANGKLRLTGFTKASYEVTDATGNVSNGYYVPANTGVLVNSIDKTATYYFPKTAATATLPANLLKPAPANGGIFTAEDGYKYYKLAYDDFEAKTGLGFYWGADNAGAFSVKAGTAYLAVPTSDANNAKGFTFDGGTTGINEVTTNDSKVKNIYNLNGQRVENMSHAGLYIVNGKKVVIRK